VNRIVLGFYLILALLIHIPSKIFLVILDKDSHLAIIDIEKIL